MATNIAGYISNLGKSVAYSAVDKVKSMSPTVGEFSSTNAELFKSMYTNIRDYKGSYTRGLDTIKRSKVYEAADVGMTSIFEDIKSGKLYNREREDKIASKIMGFGDDGNSEFGSFDDSSFDTGDDDDFGGWDDSDISTGDKMVSSSINDASKSNAEMVSMTVARTGNYIAETQKRSTHLLYTQNLQAYNLFNSNLNAINSNISNVLNFSTTTLQAHATNSTKYYEESTKLMQDQTALLRQIVGMLGPKEEKKKERTKKVSFSDIVGANGAPDLTEYLGAIKKNIASQAGSFGSIGGMFGEDSNALLSFVSSPLKFIPNMVINSLVPKTIEKSMDQLDKTLSGFFGSLISKFNTMGKDENNIFSSTIGKIFGIRNSVKSGIDTANYNKGKVDWDGKSRKALIEVIPTQLAKIVSLLSGKSERLYDYDKGQFVDSKDIEKNHKTNKKNYAKRATGDMQDQFKEYMNMMTFNSLQDKESMNNDIVKFFEQIYSSGEMFDLNGKNAKDGYLKYGIDPKNFAAIRAMYKKSNKGLQHGINKQVIEYRDRQNKDMIDMESNADSIYQYLFNNSSLQEFIQKDKKKGGTKSTSLLASNGLTSALDNKGKNIFFYLQNMYKELSYIRQFSGGDLPSSGNRVDIITGKGNNISSYTPKHSMDEITIKDTSAKTKATIDREERERKSRNFDRQEARRREKNKSLINVSNIDNEQELENTLSTMIDVDNIKKNIETNDKKKPNMLERLLQADSVSGKLEVVVDKLNGLSRKPLEFFTNTIEKVDQRLYEVIYGKEGKDGKDIKGFIDVLVLQMKSTFGKFNLWMDEKVLQPLKDKINFTSFGDMGKKFLGMFGIDGDDIGKSIKTYLFGDKNGTKGLFTDIGEGIKKSFSNVWGTVKGSMKDAYGPLFGKIKKTFKGKNKFAQLDEQEFSSNEESNQPIDWINDKAAIAKEMTRQRELKNYTGSNSGNIYGRDNNYYKYMNLSESSQSPQSRLKYLNANKNYLNSLGKVDISAKERLLNRLMEQATRPGASLRPSLLRQIDKLQSEMDMVKSNESELVGMSTRSSFISSNIHNKTNPMNVDFYEHKEKSAEELASMYPGLVNSGIISDNVENSKKGNIFSKLGTNLDEGINYLKSIKDSLLEMVGLIKPKQNKALGPRISNLNMPMSNNPLLQEEDAALADLSKNLGTTISNSLYGYLKGNISQYADGGYVDKAQVATIGKGEVVLSKENTDNLVTMMTGLLEALRGGKKSKSSIANNAFDSLMKLDKEIGGFQDLTVLDQLVTQNPTLRDKFNGLKDKSGYDDIIKALSGQLKGDHNTEVDSKGVPIDPVKKAAFLEAQPFIKQVGEEFVNGTKAVKDALFGKDEKDDKKSFGLAMDDIMTNVSKYAPEATGSALIGGGVSLVTGAIGGPLLGAAIGAGISLTKNSEKMQNWLFGEKDANDDDRRQGGVVSKNIMNTFSRYLPDLKTYGIAGAATGLLPLIPFGPLGGLMMGSAFTFAKNNEAVQNKLFGEEGLFKPEMKNKLKKVLPRLGLGAAAGLVMGPFGLMGNALLGSGIGLATTTDKFSQMILGVKDKAGKYKGGLLPTLREAVVDPIKGYMKGLGNRITDFMKTHMFKPLASAFAPLKKQVEIMVKGMFDKVGNFMNNMFEKSFGVPFNKFMEEKLIKPLSNGIGKLLKPIKWAAKGIISAPFKAVGGIGNSLRKSHIRNGNADYMSAEERMAFRNKKDMRTFGKFGTDRFRDTDEALAKLGSSDLTSMIEGLNSIKGKDKEDLDARQGIAKDMAKDIIPYFGYKESKGIMQALRNGDKDEVIRHIRLNNKIPADERLRLIQSLNDKTNKFRDITKIKNKNTENKVDIYASLEKAGFDINDSNVSKYIDLLTKENKVRSKKGSIEDTIEQTTEEQTIELTEKNHGEIVNKFDEALILLRKLVDPSYIPTSEDTVNATSHQKKFFGTIKNVSKENIKIQGKQTKQVLAEDGSVTEFIQDNRGEWVPNLSDNGTREEIAGHNAEKKEKKSFYEKIKSLGISAKEKGKEVAGNAKEKGKGILDILFGGGGLLKKLAIGGGLMAMIPGGGELLGKILVPIANGLGRVIVSAIPMLLELLKKAIGPIKDLVLGSENKDPNGDGIESSDEKNGLLNTGAKTIGFEQGTSEVGSSLREGAFRSVVGGRTGVGKMMQKMSESKGLLAPIKEFIKKPLKWMGQAQVKGANIFKNNALDELIPKSKQALSNAGSWVAEKGSKLPGSSIFKSLGDKLKKTDVKAGITSMGENNSLVKTIVEAVEKMFRNIFENKTVIRMVGSKAGEILEKALPKIVKEVGERALKAGSKALARATGAIASGGILTIAFAVADFISGFNNSHDILSLTNDQDISFGTKVVTGLIKATNGFITLGIVPESAWVNLMLDIILPIFDKKDSNIQKMRDEAEAKAAKYVEDNKLGKLSVKEYNDLTNESLWEKLKKAPKKMLDSVRKSVKKVTDYKRVEVDNPRGIVNSNNRNYNGMPGSTYTPGTPASSSAKSSADPYGMSGYAGKGSGKSPKYKYMGYGGKGGEGEKLTEDNIKFADLRKSLGSAVTAKDINAWIDKARGAGSSSIMKGQGDAFIEASKKTGLDPRYIAAHAAWESGWGDSPIVKAKNNFFGIGAFNASPGESALTFKSPRDGIIAGAEWIADNYSNKGQPTLNSMINTEGHRYAVFDDGSPNTDWVKGISNIMYRSPGIGSGSLDSSNGSYSGDGSTASAEPVKNPTIFDMIGDLGDALGKDFNTLYGFKNEEETTSGGSSSSAGGASGDRKINDFTYFSQKENPWASYNYKPSPGQPAFSDPTLAERGCGPTSAAMVVRQLTGDPSVNPATMADFSSRTGSSVDAGTGWGFYNNVASEYGLNVKQTGINANNLNAITRDKPMIISGTGGPFYGGHFMVGVNGGNGNIALNDPLSPESSKVYPIADMQKYMKQGWTYSAGGKGPEPKSPGMKIPDKNRKSDVEEGGKGNASYNKLLMTIIEVLLKISDNSSYLSKIVDILSNKLGVDIPEETKQGIKSNSSGSKQQIINIIKDSATNGNNPDNEYLLGILDGLASQ